MAKTEEATGTEVAIPDDRIAEAIASGDGGVQAFVEDPLQVSQAIVARILAAETLEEVLDQGKALHARDVLGRPFTAHAVRFNTSSFAGGESGSPGVFAVIDAEFHDDGSRAVVTCGSRNVMAQLYRAKQLGELSAKPFAIKESDTPTAAGFTPMWLVEA